MTEFSYESKLLIRELKNRLENIVGSVDTPGTLKHDINDYLDNILQTGILYPKETEHMSTFSGSCDEFAPTGSNNGNYTYPFTGRDPRSRFGRSRDRLSSTTSNIEGFQRHRTREDSVIHGIRIPAGSEVIELPVIKAGIKDFFFIYDNVRHFVSIDERPISSKSPADRMTIHSTCCSVRRDSQRRVHFNLPDEADDEQQSPFDQYNQGNQDLNDGVEPTANGTNNCRPNVQIPPFCSRPQPQPRVISQPPPPCPQPHPQNNLQPPLCPQPPPQDNLQPPLCPQNAPLVRDQSCPQPDSVNRLNEAFRELTEMEAEIPQVNPNTIPKTGKLAEVRKVIIEHPIWEVVDKTKSARAKIQRLIDMVQEIDDMPDFDPNEYPLESTVENYEVWLKNKYTEEPKSRILRSYLYEDNDKKKQDEKAQTKQQELKNLSPNQVQQLSENCDDNVENTEEERRLRDINERRRRLGVDNLDKYLPENRESLNNREVGEETFFRELLRVPGMDDNTDQEEERVAPQRRRGEQCCPQKSKKDKKTKKSIKHSH